MSKWFAPGFASHVVNLETLTLATCWLLTRKDGTAMGFTDFDRDIWIPPVVYHPEGAFRREAAKLTADAGTAKLNLSSVFNSELITANDVLAGEYDGAEIFVFEINYLSPPTTLVGPPYEYCPRIRGVVGNVTTSGNEFTAQLVGQLDPFNNKLAQLTSRTCRYEFCDDQCGLDKQTYSSWHQITQIIDRRTFVLDALASPVSDYFGEGELTFLYGANNGNTYQINNYASSRTITLYEPVRQPLALGDWVEVVAGCRKRTIDCKRFDNLINFGGEPHIPGWDALAAGQGSPGLVTGGGATPPPIPGEVPQP